MSDFFEYSQGIKTLIERNPALMRTLESQMSGIHGDLLAETQTCGIPSWQHYRIGQLEDGLWVALKHRLHSFEDGESIGILADYERFSMFAEEMANRGESITGFCVGVASDRYTALLIEDLTRGGTQNADGKLYLRFTSRLHPYNFRELRFMHEKNRIQFKPVPEHAADFYFESSREEL